MARPIHCPRCDDFGRVESDYGLLVCPEPVHRTESSLCPWDGPTAGELVEQWCRLREMADCSRRTRERWCR
jgi:hypothetical protein